MSNELQYLQDDPMPADLEPVHRRLLTDGDSWEAEQVPSPDQLAEFLRRTATRADTPIASPDVAGASSPRPARRSRVLSSALPAIAALLLISLGAALFGVMAQTRRQPVATHYPKSSCAPNQISVHQLRGIQLYGIAMVSPDEGWAAGLNVSGIDLSGDMTSSGPSLFHYSHCQWQPVPTNPTSIWFTSITMFSAQDGWALGYRFGSIVLHYDGSQWQRMPLPVPLAAGESIGNLEMLSDQEGWLVVSGQSNPGTLYHGVNGVWKAVSLGYVVPSRVVPFAPGEAWIVGLLGELVLYRDGTIVSFDQPPGGYPIGDANITMRTLQDGWLLETYPDSAYPDSPPWMNPDQGTSSQDGGVASRMLWHFDGKRWTDESALISNPRIQTAMYAQIFSAQEGWAFPVTGNALWLHDGQWRNVPWPQQGQFNGIVAMVQISPVEYWAIASYAGGPPGRYDALLHFVDGSWSVYS